MTKKVDVWGAGSTRSMRVVWTLLEFGLPFTHHAIGSRTGETLTDAYKALNPKQKIPTFRHGDLVLSESVAIAQYISEAFPVPAGFLVPDDAAGRAKLNEWCSFAAMELDAHSLYLVRRHQHLSHIYGEAPVAVASALEYCEKQLSAMAPRIAVAAPYVLGAGLSVADVVLMTCVDWAILYGAKVPGPYLAYRERVAERPAFRQALTQNFPDFVIEDGRIVGEKAK
ncbi:MAG TPA: glutathione S-transferase family protein [Alphaproteobacteria bacterium]|nr:glutathione S-transferase family protein [Alphaproteobacteria bacterium]